MHVDTSIFLLSTTDRPARKKKKKSARLYMNIIPGASPVAQPAKNLSVVQEIHFSP